MKLETPLEALPIGTARVWKRKVRKQVRQERRIKVSHHGSWRNRWRPFARHWWEQNVGPIPDGYQVYHRDGDTLNDQPANYVLCRTDRLRMILANRPEASWKQRRRRSKAVAKANRRRGAIKRALVNPSAWYLILPRSRAVVWQPCRFRRAAGRLIVPAELTALCLKDVSRLEEINAVPFVDGHPTQIVQGAELLRGSQPNGPFEGFVRLIPDVRRAPRKRLPKPIDNFVAVLADQ